MPHFCRWQFTLVWIESLFLFEKEVNLIVLFESNCWSNWSYMFIHLQLLHHLKKAQCRAITWEVATILKHHCFIITKCYIYNAKLIKVLVSSRIPDAINISSFCFVLKVIDNINFCSFLELILEDIRAKFSTSLSFPFGHYFSLLVLVLESLLEVVAWSDKFLSLVDGPIHGWGSKKGKKDLRTS